MWSHWQQISSHFLYQANQLEGKVDLKSLNQMFAVYLEVMNFPCASVHEFVRISEQNFATFYLQGFFNHIWIFEAESTKTTFFTSKVVNFWCLALGHFSSIHSWGASSFEFKNLTQFEKKTISKNDNSRSSMTSLGDFLKFWVTSFSLKSPN